MGGSTNAKKLLSQSGYDQMWTPAKLNNGKTTDYGFGWQMGEFRGCKTMGHGGAWQGFVASITRFVDEKLTVIVLINRAGANPGAITRMVAGHYDSRLVPIHAIKERHDPDSNTTQSMRNFLTDIANDVKDSPHMTPGFAAKITSNRPPTIAASLKDLKSFTYSARDELGNRAMERFGARVELLLHYKMVTGSDVRYFTFYLTAAGKVADLRELVTNLDALFVVSLALNTLTSLAGPEGRNRSGLQSSR